MSGAAKKNPVSPRVRPVVAPGKTRRTTKLTHVESEALRHLAETLFVTSQEPLSTDDLAADPRFAAVRPGLMRTWAVEGDWVQKRRDVMRAWRQKIADKLGERLATQRIRALEGMEKLYRQTMAYVSGGEDGVVAIQPRSFESTVAAAIKIDQHMQALRREVLQVAGSSFDGQSAPSAPARENMPALSPADMQQMAHTLLTQQHPEARPQVAAQAPEPKVP